MHLHMPSFSARTPVRKPFFVEERTVITKPIRRSFNEGAHKAPPR